MRKTIISAIVLLMGTVAHAQLQSSGPISVSDILSEMCRPANSTSGIRAIAQEWYTKTGNPIFLPPDNISDWYGQVWVGNVTSLSNPGTLPQAGGLLNFSVTGNGGSTATKIDDGLGTSWLSFATSSGCDNWNIVFNLQQNTTGAPRTMTIRVTGVNGGNYLEKTIYQAK